MGYTGSVVTVRRFLQTPNGNVCKSSPCVSKPRGEKQGKGFNHRSLAPHPLPAKLPELAQCNISIPLISGLSIPACVNPITICPEELAVVVNCSVMALFCPPAAAKISNALSTVVPLMATLNFRCPTAVQVSSAKCKRTVYVPPALKPGIV